MFTLSQYFNALSGCNVTLPANADELKRRGIKYCNCLACTIGLEVLKNKDLLFS